MVEKLIDELHKKVLAAEDGSTWHDRTYKKTYEAGVACGLREAYELLERLVFEEFSQRK